MHDPLSCAVNHVIAALKVAFAPDSIDPPMGGGTADVRFFHADVLPLAWFNAHMSGWECENAEPFIWVRVVSRYASSNFPTPDTSPSCKQRAAEIEVGIARCAYVGNGDDVDFEALLTDANVSLDDSRRIEKALCLASAKITAPENGCGNNTATDILQPWGPEGGAFAWVTSLYVQL